MLGRFASSSRRIPLAVVYLLVVLPAMIACGASETAPTLAIDTPAPVLEATFTPPEATATSAPIESTDSPIPESATMTPTTPPTPTATTSPTASPTATLSPTPTVEPTATETPIPPTATVTEGSVAIIGIVNDPPVGRDQDGETVTIQNNSPDPIDMTAWTLSDIAEHTYVFPPFVLQPGALVVVHICAGEDTAEILYWGRCSAIWNNEGDTAYLRDATGRDISTFTY